jgi:hypothetical protein
MNVMDAIINNPYCRWFNPDEQRQSRHENPLASRRNIRHGDNPQRSERHLASMVSTFIASGRDSG